MLTETKFGVVLGLVVLILVAVVYHAPNGRRAADVAPPGGPGNASARL